MNGAISQDPSSGWGPRNPICRLIGLALCCCALTACSPPAVKRGFERTVDIGGNPVLKVVCKYVGKKPGDPARYKRKHDYRTINTDFYTLTLQNLTDREIKIERVDYRMQKGPFRGTNPVQGDALKQKWGTEVIAANSLISRPNNMVHARADRNVMFKKYTFRFVGDNTTFEVEVPFVFAR